jgi:hypothetical protein
MQETGTVTSQGTMQPGPVIYRCPERAYGNHERGKVVYHWSCLDGGVSVSL